MKHLDAQKISEKRNGMLASLLGYISPSFHEALQRKIEYEHDSLLAIIESDTKAAHATRELNKTLRSEYFVQK